MKLLTISFPLAIATFLLMGALASQVNNYQDGNVLTAGELNSEFGNIYSTINNLDEANFSASTNFPATFLDSAVAGEGLVQIPLTGALDVNVDDSTVEVDTDVLRVKAEGITSNEIGTAAVDSDEIATDAVGPAEIAARAVGPVQTSGSLILTGNGSIENLVRRGTSSASDTIIGGSSTSIISTVNVTIDATQGITMEAMPLSAASDAYFRCTLAGVAGNSILILIKRGGATKMRYVFDQTTGNNTIVESHQFPYFKAYEGAVPAGTYTYDLEIIVSSNAFCNHRNYGLVIKKSGT